MTVALFGLFWYNWMTIVYGDLAYEKSRRKNLAGKFSPKTSSTGIIWIALAFYTMISAELFFDCSKFGSSMDHQGNIPLICLSEL